MENDAASDGSGGDDDADDELDSKYKTLTDDFADVALGTPPIAPDGGFAPGMVGMGAVVPAADPARFICLRGPCVFYWQRETFYASGNPKETWGDDGLTGPDGKPIRMPRQIDRTCLAHPGTETELTDELVYECSRWVPMSPREVKRRDKKRRAYYKKNPTHDPSFVPVGSLKRS